MSLPAIVVSVELTQIICGECAGVYAIAERVRQRHHEQGTAWNCPYCQTGWGFTGNGKLQVAERQLAAERQRHQETLSRLNITTAEKDQAQRKLKRVQRGVCPRCNRTFSNLASHMACKHPEKKP